MRLTEKSIKLLQHRGAPDSLIQLDKFDYKELIQDIKYAKRIRRNVDKKLQQKYIDTTFEQPLTDNYVFCISSDFNSQKARYLALEIFYNAFEVHRHAHNPKYHLPYWHYVFGGNYDRLRDSNFKDVVGKPSLLVIDGLYVNATEQKLEKARDLLEEFHYIPRIVITCGTCPLEFMYEKLLIAVHRVVHFGATKHLQL